MRINRPIGLMIAVFFVSADAMGIWWYRCFKSIREDVASFEEAHQVIHLGKGVLVWLYDEVELPKIAI
jgi:hypothetical protein